MAYVERCGMVWRGHWLLADGARHGSRSGFATKWEAKHFADAREVAERAAATAVDRVEAVTVGVWWERWFPAQDLAPATLETYAQQYRRHIAPRFGAVAIGEVTGLDLAGFVRGLRGRGLAPSSVTVVMSVLRDLLADAAAEGVIQAAPVMPGRGRTRHTPVYVRPGRALDLPTVMRVCARLDPQGALMVLVGVFTGMRWGEVCAMRGVFLHVADLDAAADGRGQAGRSWYEIDARIGAVHEDVHAHRFFGPPKGGHGRQVDLPPSLAALLARHIEANRGRELLFVNSRGEPIRHSDWLYQWHTACDGGPRLGRAGRSGSGPCPGARFHDLRHTHATMLAELGVPEVLRDDRLGHHPPGVRALYTHTTTAMRAAMIQSLEQLWQQVAVSTKAEAAGLSERQGTEVGKAARDRQTVGASHARCGRSAGSAG